MLSTSPGVAGVFVFSPWRHGFVSSYEDLAAVNFPMISHFVELSVCGQVAYEKSDVSMWTLPGINKIKNRLIGQAFLAKHA